jgi:hypothetical protein
MDTLTDTPTGDVVVNLDTSAISFPTLPNGTNYVRLVGLAINQRRVS